MFLDTLGTRVYGASAIALGLIGLYFGDFASVWQPVADDFPARRALAYLVATLFLAGGIATFIERTRRPALYLLAALHSVFALRWLARVVAFPQFVGTWLGFAEQLAMVVAAVIAARHLTAATRIVFAACALTFGVSHIIALQETAKMVPAWIPPSQLFWAVFTGFAHMLAAFAISSTIRAGLAARMLTLMILSFGALIWIPRLFALPQAHLSWAGNAINLSIAASCWIVAGELASRNA